MEVIAQLSRSDFRSRAATPTQPVYGLGIILCRKSPEQSRPADKGMSMVRTGRSSQYSIMVAVVVLGLGLSRGCWTRQQRPADTVP
jgi:hypothetical protein